MGSRRAADAELAARADVALPPSVHMAALDGPADAVAAILGEVHLPEAAELLGPVPLPPGARRPPGIPADASVTRMLVRVPREQGLALAAELRRGVAVVSARQSHEPVRVQMIRCRSVKPLGCAPCVGKRGAGFLCDDADTGRAPMTPTGHSVPHRGRSEMATKTDTTRIGAA